MGNMKVTPNVTSGSGQRVLMTFMCSRTQSELYFKYLVENGSYVHSFCKFLSKVAPTISPKTPAIASKAPLSLPPKVETNEDPVECTANVLLPHEVFGALHRRDRKQVGCSKLRISHHVF